MFFLRKRKWLSVVIAAAFLFQFTLVPVGASAKTLLDEKPVEESASCNFHIVITKQLEDGTIVDLTGDVPGATLRPVENIIKSSNPVLDNYLQSAHSLVFELLDANGDVLATAQPEGDDLVFSFQDDCSKWANGTLPDGYTLRETGPNGEIFDTKYELTLSSSLTERIIEGKLNIINPVPSDDTVIEFRKGWSDPNTKPPVATVLFHVSIAGENTPVLDVPVNGKNDWTTKAYFFKEDLDKFGSNLENISVTEEGPAGYVPAAVVKPNPDVPGESSVMIANLDKVTVVKNWVGDQPSDRPDEVVVQIKDSKTNKIVSDKVSIKPTEDNQNSWEAIVPILPEAEVTTAENLVVVEEPIPGYKAEASKWDPENNTLVITNTKITEETGKNVPVVKKWAAIYDNEPQSVKLSLLVKEKNSQEPYKVISQTTISGPEWRGVFENVPAEIGDSNKYEWTIKEEGADQFVIDSVSFADLQTGFTVVNKLQEYPQLIKDDHFAYMTGYPDGTFGPERYITRAEVTVMFSRLMVEKMHIGVKYPSRFPDVTADKWYADNIGHMENFNVVRGYLDGTFKPDQNVTRAEFAAIVSRFDKLTPSGKVNFVDVPATHWAKEVIDSAVTKGWFGGYAGNIFKPDDPIKRSEVVAVVNRMIERQADLDFIKAHPTEIKHYTDLNEMYWAYADILEASNSHDFEKQAEKEIWLKIRPIE